MPGKIALSALGAALQHAGRRVRQPLSHDLFVLRRHFSHFAGIAGAVVLLLGLVVLFGWAAPSSWLHSLRPNWPAMQPNLALGLAFCGASLWLLADEHTGRSARVTARLLAAAALLIGALVLVEYLYRIDLRIDRLLFGSRLDAARPLAGRLAPADAVELLLCGLGLLLVDTETRSNQRPTELVAVLIALIALPTLVSFSFGALPKPSTLTSLHGSAGFCLLSLGLLFARPHRGLAAIVTGPDIGGVATRRLLPFFVLVPVGLGALFVALHAAGLLGPEWVAPLLASSTVAAFVALGFLTTLSFHHSDVDRSRAERRLYAQYGATRALTESPTVDEAIPVILRSFAESLGWDVGTLWRVDPDRKAIRCVQVWHRPSLDVSQFEARTRELVFQRGVGTPGRVWMTGEPAWVPDLPRFPSFRAGQAERHGLHAGFAFPIRYLNRVTGVIEFFSREVRAPDGDIVAMAGVLGSQVGEAIERKYAEEHLRVSEDRFRAVAETARDAFMFVDAGGLVSYLNPAAERMFLAVEGEMIGRPVAALLPELPAAGSDSLSGRTLETIGRRSDGRELPVEISLAGWKSAGGAEFSAAIIRDITARRQAEEAVRKARDAAEASNRELEAFSYSVSHDLRKPLRAIEGFSRALLDEFASGLDERGKDYASRVASAAERMSLLMDDLLELSRAARVNLQIQTVDLSDIAHEVATALRRSEPERAVEIVVQDGLVVRGDEALLRSVMENLLENAWKFTSRRPHSRIEFGAVADPTGPPTYFVRDDGAGFDPAYAKDLFRPFERLHKDSEFPGTGVGLAIVQRIVRRHGGRVWAEGGPEKGATFYFTLAEAGAAGGSP